MFFYLSKILAFFTSPLVWVMVLFLVGLLMKNKIKGRTILIIAAIALYVFSNSFFVDECMRQYEFVSKDFQPAEKFEYAVVLGGMISYDERLDKPQFSNASDRIFQLLPLLKKGNIKKILISGGSGSILKPDHKEAAILKKYLLDIGIPDSVISIENESKNTRENAVNTKKILEEKKIKSPFLLVTSAFHMKRAKACFEKVGLTQFRVFCTDGYSGPRKFQFDHCLIPNPHALSTFTLLIHEVTGYLVYWCMDYL